MSFLRQERDKNQARHSCDSNRAIFENNFDENGVTPYYQVKQFECRLAQKYEKENQ